MTDHPDLLPLLTTLQHSGFAFVTGQAMRGMLEAQALADWPAFAASWSDLAPDTYLAARGRRRRRRHAVFSAKAGGEVHRERNQPHFQSLRYNPLQGDIQRWFGPIRPAVADGPSLRRILGFCRALFDALAPDTRHWHIEVHQFRIEARAGEPGEPTPEGVHRDGVDYVLVLLIARENIESGTTTIHAGDGSQLGSFILSRPLDAALVDDARVSHGVTPVTPFDPDRPAYRDVLVVTFKAAAPGG
ncbi:MAG: 2OG-Fe dioxygenase family protein [Xanthomonadaceae bacterium]|nr:2OG-Fe dioxygenase family protein [Xanthomonadaceae bacterium]